ncbi:lytic transglycosylase domain-containing protein [Sphingomonas sp.]|uniref:lytic transglycosylase domain-containing protein n=1 Tax=Sphingomonas sp. TaxID=28214 RepID=UPI0025E63D8B|nr:lytic transglycosylase domain-containing protein [Sphingomonas sp.]
MTKIIATGMVSTIALFAAFPAAAQDLMAPPPPRSFVAPSNAGLSDALAQWMAIRQSESLPFSSYADFLLRHPGWPGEAALRKVAERQLRPDSVSPSQVLAYFARYPAQSPSAALRYAEALESTGQRDAARDMARRAWTTGPLSLDDEQRLLARFAGALTQQDQDQRTDRLLWARSTANASRQMALSSPIRQPIFDARIAMQGRTPDAFTKVSLTSDSARGDAGYLADRANWLRATGQEFAARALLAAPRRLTYTPLDPDRWLDTLYSFAKGAADAGSWQVAYDIARQVDDTYPAGTVIRDRPLSERDDYTNLTWLAGTAALNRLGRPADAIALFDKYSQAARSPQTQVKGIYWAGRAAEAAGRRSEADGYYRRAAAYFDQFYGQLANERLGTALTIPPVTRTIEISANERDAFFGREIVRAASYLGSSGDWASQSLFVRAIAAAAETDKDHVLASELAVRINRPDLGVMVGRSAGINGLRDYVRTGFPIVPVTPENQPSWTMIHAIARQESQFDRKIVSRAGARGLMQLMPGTARDVAGKTGVAYNAASLDDPTFNASLGSWYFGRLMDRYSGNYVLSVAAYNAGAGNVNKWLAANGDPRAPGADVLAWIEAIPFKETRDYVQRVLENAVVYDLLNPRAGSARRNPLSTYLGKSNPG